MLNVNIKIVRLPDITNYKYLDNKFDDYGRFGLTYRNAFYVHGIQSSHLQNTKDGGYWAVNKKTRTLYLSPRGANLGFELFVNNILRTSKIDQICRKAGLK